MPKRDVSNAELLANHFGFALQSTGGDCTAFVHNTDDGHEYLITKPNDPMAPESICEHCVLSCDGVIIFRSPDLEQLLEHWNQFA
jgi:hypothetical protein